MSTSVAKSENEKFCTECGTIIRAHAEICPACGVRQMQPLVAAPMRADVVPNGKSKVTAGLLALFLGGIGAHKFYLGQVGWGVVYLLFCWTLIPALVGLIEAIILLTMSDQSFGKRYGGWA